MHTNDAATLTRAATLNRPMLLLFTTSWCPYCQRLEETVWHNATVVQAAREFFCVRIDGDAATADALMAKFQVPGYPTVIFAKPDLTPLGAWGDAPTPHELAAQMHNIAKSIMPHVSWAQFAKNALPVAELASDHYMDDAKAREQAGDTDGARAIYRDGGFLLLKQINAAKKLRDVQSQLAPALRLLRSGVALVEAEELAQRAITTFPDDYLYYYHHALILRDQGQMSAAIQEGAKAYALSYARNRLWVADALSDMLVQQGDRDRARAIIAETLAGVNWQTNPRAKALEYKSHLEHRRAQIDAPPH